MHPTIPSKVWGTGVTQQFAESAELGQGRQTILCATCVREGLLEAPSALVLVGGTSLCTQHV